jgi:AcrR family transcriptional regulator
MGEIRTRAAVPAKETAPRANYHHGDLADSLRSASLAILSEVGVDAFTLREAARRSGVNHRAVYRHFEDKRALLADLAAAGYRILAADMQRAVSERIGKPNIEGLLLLATAFLMFARRESARYQLMFGPRLNEDQRFPELEAAIDEAVVVLGREITSLRPDASPTVLRDAGITVFSAIHGMSSLVLVRRVKLRENRVESYVRTIMTPVFEGLLVTLRG